MLKAQGIQKSAEFSLGARTDGEDRAGRDQETAPGQKGPQLSISSPLGLVSFIWSGTQCPILMTRYYYRSHTSQLFQFHAVSMFV